MRVAELWRYPVKSLAGEQLDAVDILLDGIPGDRVVQVHDARGRIVADLKPADFEVREETTPLTLEAVRPVQAASPEESLTPVTTPGKASRRRRIRAGERPTDVTEGMW